MSIRIKYFRAYRTINLQPTNKMDTMNRLIVPLLKAFLGDAENKAYHVNQDNGAKFVELSIISPYLKADLSIVIEDNKVTDFSVTSFDHMDEYMANLNDGTGCYHTDKLLRNPELAVIFLKADIALYKIV